MLLSESLFPRKRFAVTCNYYCNCTERIQKIMRENRPSRHPGAQSLKISAGLGQALSVCAANKIPQVWGPSGRGYLPFHSGDWEQGTSGPESVPLGRQTSLPNKMWIVQTNILARWRFHSSLFCQMLRDKIALPSLRFQRKLPFAG